MESSPKKILFITFVAGLAIMAAEISASRLLAPYYGTSIFVWTNIIGVVMASLAAGYYMGGRLADKQPRMDLLLLLLLGAGIALLFVPELIKPLSGLIDLSAPEGRTASAAIFLASLASVSLLFSIPMILLGAVSPFALKLYTKGSDDKIGSAAGVISAMATAGSIVGTFLPALVLIPLLGTKLTIHLCGFVLAAIGSAGLKRRSASAAAVLAAFAYVLYFSGGGIKFGSRIVFEDESVYQYISVYDGREGARYMAYNEGAGIQSVYYRGKPLTGYYFDLLSAMPAFFGKSGQFKAAIIGLSGGTIPRQLRHFYGSRAEMTGVEIDKKVIQAARDYFSLDETGIEAVNADGRMALRNSPQKYDYIVVDAYSQELYIPWSMTTEEFWELVKSRLNPGGITAINVNAISDQAEILMSIRNTMAAVFKDVYVTQEKEGDWNYIITASEDALDFNALPETVPKGLEPVADVLAKKTKKAGFDPALRVLTDDKAPIENMTDKMALDFIFGRK